MFNSFLKGKKTKKQLE